MSIASAPRDTTLKPFMTMTSMLGVPGSPPLASAGTSHRSAQGRGKRQTGSKAVHGPGLEGGHCQLCKHSAMSQGIEYL